jgi:excinuclease ABC subunit C
VRPKIQAPQLDQDLAAAEAEKDPAGLAEAATPFVPEPIPGSTLEQAIDAANAFPPEITGGDDYAMMRQVLTRRFARALKEDPDRSKGNWPDLVLIDGGAGQLSQAQAVLADLGINDVCIVGIAKGPDRDAGRERFFMPGKPPFSLEPRDPVLYFLQRLRDEAHRFAIGTHRGKRSRGLIASALDEVPGIGAARKKALLHHFGSPKSIAAASLADLEAVPGISGTVARKIFAHFHDGG